MLSSFLFTLRADLFDESIDFGGLKLSLELGHVMFPIGDDGPEIVGGHGRRFPRHQRWATHEMTFGRLTMTFGAIFLIDGVGGQRTLGFGFLSVRNESNARDATENKSEPGH